MTPQQIEAMKMALDLATMHHTDDGYAALREKVRSASKEALAQPEQIPPSADSNTHQPQRTWVGLTDEEYFALQMKIKKPMTTVQDYIDAMRIIEQALKEKNT